MMKMMRYSFVVLSVMAGHVFAAAGVPEVGCCGCWCWRGSKLSSIHPAPDSFSVVTGKNEPVPAGPPKLGAAGGAARSTPLAQPAGDSAEVGTPGTLGSVTVESAPAPRAGLTHVVRPAENSAGHIALGSTGEGVTPVSLLSPAGVDTRGLAAEGDTVSRVSPSPFSKPTGLGDAFDRVDAVPRTHSAPGVLFAAGGAWDKSPTSPMATRAVGTVSSPRVPRLPLAARGLGAAGGGSGIYTDGVDAWLTERGATPASALEDSDDKSFSGLVALGVQYVSCAKEWCDTARTHRGDGASPVADLDFGGERPEVEGYQTPYLNLITSLCGRGIVTVDNVEAWVSALVNAVVWFPEEEKVALIRSLVEEFNHPADVPAAGAGAGSQAPQERFLVRVPTEAFMVQIGTNGKYYEPFLELLLTLIMPTPKMIPQGYLRDFIEDQVNAMPGIEDKPAFIDSILQTIGKIFTKKGSATARTNATAAASARAE